jgi:hypothetical protein
MRPIGAEVLSVGDRLRVIVNLRTSGVAADRGGLRQRGFGPFSPGADPYSRRAEVQVPAVGTQRMERANLAAR